MAGNPCITIQVDFTDLDKAIAKVNELTDLLEKASRLVDEIAKKSPADANKFAALVLGIQKRQEDVSVNEMVDAIMLHLPERQDQGLREVHNDPRRNKEQR